MRFLKTITYPLYMVLPLIIGCSVSSTGPDNRVHNNNYVAQEEFSYTFDHVNQTRLRLEGISGDISITSRPEPEIIEISGIRAVGSESISDAEAHLRLLEVDCRDLGNEIYIKTVQPSDSQGRDYRVDYTIVLPSTMSLIIDDINGEIRLNNIESGVEAGTINGNIVGNIELPLDGNAGLSVINGNISIEIPQNTSASFEARVVNGRISLHEIPLDDEYISHHKVTGVMGDGRGSLITRATNGTIDITGY